MNLINKLQLTCCLLIFTLVGLFAQSPRFDSYPILNQGKNVKVNSMLQDSLGYVWLGTNHGLAKFNGTSFQMLTTSDGLSENGISALALDAENRLWVGHSKGGITTITEKMVQPFNPEEGLSAQEVSHIFFDTSNKLWFATYGEGVYYYAGENRLRLYNLSVEDGLLDNYVYSIACDNNQNMYFGTDKGVSIYNLEKKQFVGALTMSNGLPDNLVKQLFIKDAVLWIGMDEGGICSYDINNKVFENITDWPFSAVNAFEYINDNQIWVSTKRDGVVNCQLAKGEITFSKYSATIGLASNQALSLLKDREDNIWVGTNKGLSVRRNNRLEFLNEQDGFPIKNVYSFTIDQQGSYWFASDQGLFVGTKDLRGKIINTQLFNAPNYSDLSFISLYTDAKGFVWAGTYGFGLYRINPRTHEYTHFSTKNGLSNDNVIHITGDAHFLWVSTLGGGVSKIDLSNRNKIVIYNSDTGFPSDYVYSVFIDSKNRKWVSSDGSGVIQIADNEALVQSSMSDPNQSSIVYSGIEDAKGTLWFNFSDKGIYSYRDSCELVFSEENGLKTAIISALALDFDNTLLAVSNEGIDWIDLSNKKVLHLGQEAGVANLNPNLNAIFKDGQQNIWVGTGSGMLKILSRGTTGKHVKPKLFIKDIQLFDKNLGTYVRVRENSRRFRYNHNHFKFNYLALWFKTGKEHKYRYRLEGYDLNWQEETSLQTASYSNLSPAKYNFEVQVKYNNQWYGLPNASFSFEIVPPFWRQLWFIIAAILLLGFLVWSFIKYRIKSLEEAKTILEDEVQKRTWEIQEQKDEIEAQKNEIEAQRDYVTSQKDQIEKQNTSITSSIQYASRIQSAVLPPCDLFEEKLNDHFIYFQPRDIVSGDFYYINQLGNKVVVAAADCTGHGVPGALMSILGISILNQFMGADKKELTAAAVLDRLREAIISSLRQTGKSDEAKDGMDIALAVLDKENNQVEFAGAYNPLVLVRNGEMIHYKGDRMPIGIYSYSEDHFNNQVIPVQKDDMIYLYSDGFQDQFGGEEGRKFLPKKLKTLLCELSNEPLKVQHDKLDEAFKTWKGDLPQVDDVLVIGIRI